MTTPTQLDATNVVELRLRTPRHSTRATGAADLPPLIEEIRWRARELLILAAQTRGYDPRRVDAITNLVCRTAEKMLAAFDASTYYAGRPEPETELERYVAERCKTHGRAVAEYVATGCVFELVSAAVDLCYPRPPEQEAGQSSPPT